MMELNVTGDIRELNQLRRQWRRVRKRHMKSKSALFQILSSLFHLVQLTKCWRIGLDLNSKRLYRSSGKNKNVVVSCFRPPQNVKVGSFTLQ